MMATNIEKNSAVSEEGHVLTAYGFYLVVSLVSMQIKSFWNPFSKINSGLNLEIYIDPSAWPAGSAVRIKENRPKGKIVFKKRDLTEKKKTVQRNRKQRRRESNPVYLHVPATPWPLHYRRNTWYSADSRPIYRTPIFWLSTKCRPTIDRVLTNYWPIHRSSIDQLSAKCRRSIGERKAISAEIHLERLSTDYPPCLDRVSTDYRPSVDRYVDRVSSDYRLLYRPIDRTTLPTVNIIRLDYLASFDFVKFAENIGLPAI